VDFHRRDPALPGLEEVIKGLENKAFGGAPPKTPRLAEIRRSVQWVVVRRLIGLASDPQAAPGVRSRVESELRSLGRKLGTAGAGASAEAAQRTFLAGEIGRYLDRRQDETGKRPEPPPPPPGQPIGGAESLPEDLGGCSWGG
jgi:hypothetical protein